MILQNSTDIKTEMFYNEEGDMAPIDVKFEKHTINPNGLIQLQNIPSLHTVFTIKGKEGITVTTYNKDEVIDNQYDFTVDYINGILTFHNSQVGKEIQVSYTNAIGRLSLSADRIFTNLDQQGNVVKTLNTLIEEGQSVLSKLDTVGGATKIIDEMRAYIDSIKSLRPQIIEGSNTSLELKKDINNAKLEKANLTNEIDRASEQIDEMNNWVESNGNIVNLNNRVTTTEGKLNTVSTQLEQNMQYTNNLNFMEGIQIFAHRGMVQFAPENTIPAILMAKKYGINKVEIDIRETSDGELILHHDETVDRMTNGTGKVSELTLAQIKGFNIDFGNNINKYQNLKVPTLEEVLKIIKSENMNAMIHMYAYSTSNVKKLIDLINKYRLNTKVIISNDWTVYMDKIREFDKTIQISYIVSKYDDNITNYALKISNCYLGTAGNFITKEQVDHAHSLGIRIITDTCYSNQNYYDSKEKNVDIILSDILVGGVLNV